MKQQKSGITDFFEWIKNKFFIAALFSGVAIIFPGCNEEVQKIPPLNVSQDQPVIYATNFETTFIDSSKVQFYMKAPVLQKFETQDRPFIEFPKGILLIKYGPNGNIISRITADYAREYEKEERWEAKNNVVAVNSQGDTLKTEYLVWDEKAEKVYSDKFVTIIRPDQIFTGTGFEADQNLENWKIKDPKGTFNVEVKRENVSTSKGVDEPKKTLPAPMR